MKTLLLFIIFLVSFINANGQKSYDEAIEQGDSIRYSLKPDYKKALDKYFAAEAFDPLKKDSVKLKIDSLFYEIENLKKEADKNAESAVKEKAKSEKLNEAYILHTYASEILNEDPTAALSLEKTAIDKTQDQKNPIFSQAAEKIYRDNSFYKVVEIIPDSLFYDLSDAFILDDGHLLIANINSGKVDFNKINLTSGDITTSKVDTGITGVNLLKDGNYFLRKNIETHENSLLDDSLKKENEMLQDSLNELADKYYRLDSTIRSIQGKASEKKNLKKYKDSLNLVDVQGNMLQIKMDNIYKQLDSIQRNKSGISIFYNPQGDSLKIPIKNDDELFYSNSNQIIIKNDNGKIELYDLKLKNNKPKKIILDPASVSESSYDNNDISATDSYAGDNTEGSELSYDINDTSASESYAGDYTEGSELSYDINDTSASESYAGDYTEGSELSYYDNPTKDNHFSYLAISKDKKLLLTQEPKDYYGYNQIILWERSKERDDSIFYNKKSEFEDNDYAGSISYAEFASDGHTLLAGFQDNSVVLLDIELNIIQKFKGHSDLIKCIAYSKDPNYFFTLSLDNTVRKWKINNRPIEFKLNYKNETSGTNDSTIDAEIYSLNYALQKCDSIQNVKTEDLNKYEDSMSVNSPEFIAYLSYADSFYIDYNDKMDSIENSDNYSVDLDDSLYAVYSNKLDSLDSSYASNHYFNDYFNAINALKNSALVCDSLYTKLNDYYNLKSKGMSSYDKYIASTKIKHSFSTDETSITFYYPDKTKKSFLMNGDSITEAKVKTEPQDISNTLLSFVKWGQLSLSERNKLNELKIDSAGYCFWPDSESVLIGKGGYTIKRSNLEGNLIKDYKVKYSESISRITFSRDDKLILLGYIDGQVELYNDAGKPLFIKKEYQSPITVIAISPDEKHFIYSDLNSKSVKLRNTDGTLIKDITANNEGVNSVWFSPKGKYILLKYDSTASLYTFPMAFEDFLKSNELEQIPQINGYLVTRVHYQNKDGSVVGEFKRDPKDNTVWEETNTNSDKENKGTTFRFTLKNRTPWFINLVKSDGALLQIDLRNKKIKYRGYYDPYLYDLYTIDKYSK